MQNRAQRAPSPIVENHHWKDFTIVFSLNTNFWKKKKNTSFWINCLSQPSGTLPSNIKLMYVIPYNPLSDLCWHSVKSIQCMVKRPELNEREANRYSFEKVTKLRKEMSVEHSSSLASHIVDLKMILWYVNVWINDEFLVI